MLYKGLIFPLLRFSALIILFQKNISLRCKRSCLRMVKKLHLLFRWFFQSVSLPRYFPTRTHAELRNGMTPTWHYSLVIKITTKCLVIDGFLDPLSLPVTSDTNWYANKIGHLSYEMTNFSFIFQQENLWYFPIAICVRKWKDVFFLDRFHQNYNAD